MKTSMLIHPDELSKKWIDKLANAGINTLGIHPVGGREAANALKELVGLAKTTEYRSLIDYAKARGLKVEYEIHAASYLMPRELFATHPEYFRVDQQGNRTPEWNFCVSHPKALELFAQRAAMLAKDLYGSNKNYYFWLDDGRDYKCHCERCRTLSKSDQQLIVVNAVARKLRESDPDARVAYLAYIDTLEIPENADVESGVFLEYAPFEKYTAKGEYAQQRIEKAREMLVPLMKFFDKEPPKVLEYWYDNSLFSGWKKPPKQFRLDEKELFENVNEYHSLGFDYISTFACFLGEDYEALFGEVDVSHFARAVKDL